MVGGGILSNRINAKSNTKNFEKLLQERTVELSTLKKLLKKESTIRKRLEKSLNDAEEKYKTLIETSDDMIFIVDLEGNFQFFNKALKKHLGFTKKEMEKINGFELVHPDDLEYVKERFKLLLEGKKVNDLEYRYKTKDGSYIYVLNNAAPILDFEGKIVATFGIAHDLTNRKLQEAELKQAYVELDLRVKERTAKLENANEALKLEVKQHKKLKNKLKKGEEKYRTLFEKSTASITLVDTQGTIVDCNNATEDLIGYSKEEIIGKPFKNLMTLAPKDIPDLKKKFGRLLKGLDTAPYELEITCRDGSKRWINILNSALKKDGKIVGFQIISTDFTDRKQAEEAIKNAKQLTDTAINAQNDTFFVFDHTNGKPILWNGIFRKVSGYTDEEIAAMKAPYNWYSKDDLKKAEKATKKILKGGRVTFEMELITKSGKRVPTEYSASLMRDFKGKPKYIIAIGRDITEHKQAEKALQKSEEKYRSLVLNIPDVTWTTDSKGITKFISPNVEQIYGYTPAEIYKRGDRLWFSRIHLDDINRVKKTFSILFKKGTPLDIVYRIQRKDGKWIWLRNRSIGTYKKDGVTYADGVFFDITDRKQAENALQESEKKYRDLVENINDVIYKVGIDGTINYVSPTIKLILGYTPSEIIGQKLNKFVYKEDLQRVLKNVGMIFSGKSTGNEYRIVTKSGDIRWVRTSSRPIIRNGKVFGLQGVISNITKRKLAEDAVRLSEEKFSKFFEQSSNVLMVFDMKTGTRLEMNKAYEEITGYSRKETSGKSIFEYDLIMDKDKIIKGMQKLKDGKVEQRNYEIRICRKDGEIRTLLYSGELMEVGGNNLVLVTGQDITDRKKAEEALQESEEKFRNIVQSSPMGMHMYQLEPDGQLIFAGANPAADKILGIDHSQFIGKAIEDAFPSSKNTEIPQKYRLAAQKGKPWHNVQVNYEDEKVKGAFEVYAFQTSPGRMVASFLEITDRIEAEEDLRKSEEKYRSLVESAKEAIITADSNGIITSWNRGAQEMLGYKSKDVIGKPLFKIIPKKLYEQEKKMMRKVRKMGFVESYDSEGLAKDGTIIPVELSLSSMKDKAGKVIGFSSIVRDITERKKAEEVIRDSEERFRTFFENEPEYCYMVSPDGKILSVNNSALKALGYKKSELIGKSIKTVYAPEILPKMERIFKKWKITGNIENEEMIIVTKKGERRSILLSASAVKDHRGKIQHSISVQRDITERKQVQEALRSSEDRYRTVSELISDFVYSIRVNPDGTQVSEWSTETLTRIIGMNHDELLARGGWKNIIHPDDLSIVIERQKNLATGKSDVSEYRVTTKTGDIHWVRDYGYPIWDKAQKRVVRIYGAAQDITKRKRAELALRRSKERFVDIVNLLPEAVFEVDVKGKLIYANQRAFKMFGYSQEDMDKGLNASQMLIPNDQERVMQNMHRILDGEKLGVNEYTALKKNGAMYPVLIHSAAIIQDGKPMGLRGIIVDITDRKRSEEALRQSEERLRSVFESSPDAITVTNLNGIIYDCNEQTKLLHGAKSKNELIGNNSFRYIAKKDHKRAKENMEKVLEYGIGRNIEYTFLTNTGREYAAELSASVMKDAVGKPSGFVAITKDITQRKRLEEKLKSKLNETENLFKLSEALKYSDTIEDVCRKGLFSICSGLNFPRGLFFMLDQKHEFLTLTQSIGFGEINNVIKISLNKNKNILTRAIQENKWFTVQKGQIINDDGKLMFIKVLKDKLRFPNKKDTFIVVPINSKKRVVGAVILDLITVESFSKEDKEMLEMYLTTIGIAIDNVQLYYQLDSSYKNLKAIDRMRTEFIDVASHELRTPLASIKIYTDLMRKGYIGNFSKDEISQLEDMNKNIIDLNNLISDMLDFSRTESDFSKLKLKKIALTDIVKEVMDNFSSLAKTRKIKMNMKTKGDTATNSDYQMVKKVVTNLISNAIKYSHDGKNIIVNVHEKGDHTVVSIKDTGIGISEKDLPHIFERFYMGDTSLTREKDQLGLGLSIAKSIVERHGGKIWADSKLGKGSVFSFTIPKQPIKNLHYDEPI